jgi:hypothetical protein
MPRSLIEGCAIKKSKRRHRTPEVFHAKLEANHATGLPKYSAITGAMKQKQSAPKYGVNPQRMKVTLPRVTILDKKLDDADS